jgi:protein Tex
MTDIRRQIAQELGVRDQQVEAAISLLDGGATVPFIARYRKELTGALDDAQLRTLEERLTYLRELEERRTTILNSIREQGKLDAALESSVPTPRAVWKTSTRRSSRNAVPRRRLPGRPGSSLSPSCC